jgi:hypothetical protein
MILGGWAHRTCLGLFRLVSAAKECQQIGVQAGRCRHAASHETRRRKPRFGKEVRHARLSIVAALTSLALAVQVPLSALAAGADFAPARNDDIARRCVTFSSVYDRQYSDPRTALDDNSVAEALRVCAQAAEVLPVRPFDYKRQRSHGALEARRRGSPGELAAKTPLREEVAPRARASESPKATLDAGAT